MPIGFITNLLSRTVLLEHAAAVGQDQHAQMQKMQRRSRAHHGLAAEHAYWRPSVTPRQEAVDRLAWLGMVRHLHKQPMLLVAQRMSLSRKRKSHHGREPSPFEDADSVELSPHTHESAPHGPEGRSRKAGLDLTRMVFSSEPKSETTRWVKSTPPVAKEAPRRRRGTGLGQFGH